MKLLVNLSISVLNSLIRYIPLNSIFIFNYYKRHLYANLYRGIAFNLFLFLDFISSSSNPIQFGIHFLFNLTKILHFVIDIWLLLPLLLPLLIPSPAKSLLECYVVYYYYCCCCCCCCTVVFPLQFIWLQNNFIDIKNWQNLLKTKFISFAYLSKLQD